MRRLYRNHLYILDAHEFARALPANSLDSIVTSPPYYNLRDYKAHGQIGRGQSLDEYIDNLVCLFRELRRALKPRGTVWLNLGDSYSTHRAGRTSDPFATSTINGSKIKTAGRDMSVNRDDYRNADLPEKNLIGVPWRVAFALQADGWMLRSDIIWHKVNPKPESVRDRPTVAHEYIFLLVQQADYYYDADAISTPLKASSVARYTRGRSGQTKHGTMDYGQKKEGINVAQGAQLSKQQASGIRTLEALNANTIDADVPRIARANARTVWSISSEPLRERHFAAFPRKLIRPMILAGSPIGGIVCDPFVGSGTVALEARAQGRDFIGCDINPDYVAIAYRRLEREINNSR